METDHSFDMYTYDEQSQQRASLSQQATMPQPALTIPPPLEDIDTQQLYATTTLLDDAEKLHKKQKTTRKTTITRIIALVCVLASIAAVYLGLRSLTTSAETPTGPTQTTSTTNPAATTASTANNNGGTIQVYIVGAVNHPGVYTLDANARIYQLLKAAGGPQADANLVAVNLAEALKDGEEVYIPAIGEATPPNNGGIVSNVTPTTTTSNSSNSSGQLVNINTASETEMRQQLHISAQSANKIIAYRSQHGPYTSVAQLANVVSKSVYDKIKNEVTV